MIKHDVNTIPLLTHTPSQNILHFILKVNLYDQLQFVNKK